MNVQLFPSLGRLFDFAALKSSIDWQQRSVTVYGKTYPQPRLTKWYASVPYEYSGLRWEADSIKHPSLIDEIRLCVEHLALSTFNSVLCNLYRDGQDTVGWHADDEPIFGEDPVVASVSFGATRTFQLRPNKGKSKDIVSYELTDGSVFVMGKGVQQTHKHCLPRTTKPVGERINLTFRSTV
jgi:alkylated DNA repair dioxygenase AlkB